MRYLVTGGAGFIGSHTVDELVRRGHEVTVVDDLSTGKAANLSQVRTKIKFIQESIVNLETLREACCNVDYVVHLAAQTSVPRSINDPVETNLINVNGTLNVLVAAREAKVKRVVFACSCAVYGKTSTLPITENVALDPISPYGVSKQLGEAYGRVFHDLYGLEFISLRYFNVFGPRQDPGSPYSGVLSIFNENLLKGTAPFVYGDGEQSRDFVYVENVVQANLLASEIKSGSFQAINVGTGNRYTLNQTLALLEKITGRPAHATHAPARDGDIRDSQADIRLAKEALGYDPRVTFEEGLKYTWEWFSTNPQAPILK
ncbi:MAG TPA: SDR family oxidoreductase [Candidatus Acidoferrales bacterium]|jgi:nucleoside-diphosphate-sugar epimerase|nr:SDR family oxidoreductase [Candidatus Acidoferrales bacterium]